MSDQDVERTPLRAMAARWPVTLVLVLACTGAGVALAQQLPTTYTAEARLAVGGSDLSAQAVPGFALASSEIAANYARFVSIAPVREGLSPSEQSRLKTVTASPLPDSNVIRVEATATSSATAVRAASAASTRLREQVAQAAEGTTPEAALASYTDVSDQVAAVQEQQKRLESQANVLEQVLAADNKTTSPALERLLAQQAALNAKLYPLQAQQNALGVKYQNLVNEPASQSQLDIVQEAVPAFDDGTSRLERFGLAGIVLGLLLALGVATLLERRRVRGAPSGAVGPARTAGPGDRPAEATGTGEVPVVSTRAR